MRLESRRNNDWTAQFPSVAAAVKKLPAKRALLDGEVAAVLPSGLTSFQGLQNVGAGGTELVYFVFDLRHLDGEDVSALPLLERALRKISSLCALVVACVTPPTAANSPGLTVGQVLQAREKSAKSERCATRSSSSQHQRHGAAAPVLDLLRAFFGGSFDVRSLGSQASRVERATQRIQRSGATRFYEQCLTAHYVETTRRIGHDLQLAGHVLGDQTLRMPDALVVECAHARDRLFGRE